MSSQDPLAAALGAAGLDPAAGWLSAGGTDAPRPPEGPWVVVPAGAGALVGAMGRGSFAEYARVSSLDEAVALVVRLVGEPPARVPAPSEDELGRRGAVTAAGILEQTAQRGGQAGTALVAPGDLLDLVGPDTGHHLYALGTPFAQRSQPPTDIGRDYHRYEVRADVEDASEGVVAPWFEQPGGGAMVVLRRPVRWYVDHGVLAELD